MLRLYHWEPNANSGKPMLALAEKGVPYESHYLDLLKFDQHQPAYLAVNPDGTIPAMVHGDLVLTESTPMMEYVDEAFDGPALQPADARGRARMGQMTGMLDAYGYRAMVWDVAVERLEKAEPDETLIADGLSQAETVLKVLTSLKADGPWLLGDQLTLADLHAAPIVGYFVKVAEGQKLLAEFPEIQAWWGRIAARQAFAVTEKAD